MQNILLFGAGKSSHALIEYLKIVITPHSWHLVIADANETAAKEKAGLHPLVTPVKLDIHDADQRKELIKNADVVISLLPPTLHIIVATDCVTLEKHLLTASYVDDHMRKLESEIQKKNLLFLCEMGLDPGLDHMSAMKLINDIKEKGGVITSFKSHCGGLIAMESDTNPWHYKITWNPANVVNAGKSGAVFKEEEEIKQLPYESLFSYDKMVDVPGAGLFACYPNRDSISYIDLYNLHSAKTFIRTTLRHPEFIFGWKNIVDLKLTNEDFLYDTDGLSYADFFKEHFHKYGFAAWLNEMLMSRLAFAKEMMESLVKLMEAEEEAEASGQNVDAEMMMVNEQGELNMVHMEEVKDKAAETVVYKMHEANLSMKQLFFLGLDDAELINSGKLSAAQVLQKILEKKLAMLPTDKDWVVMMHEITYTLNGKTETVKSTLSLEGENAQNTAMAKTVGLPLGIATRLLMEGKLAEKGLHIPTEPWIYYPVLLELKNEGIHFIETFE